MTPKQAGEIMRRARDLLRAGTLTPYDFAVLDCLTWRCRPHGSDRLSVGYRRIAQLTGICKATAVQAVERLIACGLVQRIKRRVRVRWGAAIASRQASNVYVLAKLAPHTESTRRPASKEQGRKKACSQGKSNELDAALARLAARMGLAPPISAIGGS